MALTTFVLAAVVRLIWLSKRPATATPAASSDGLVILEPELSRDNDFASMSWLDWRLEAAARAWMFVLMTIVCVRYGVGVLVLSGLTAGTFIRQFGDGARATGQRRFVALLNFVIHLLAMDRH